jgi:hypothetical protein
MRRLFKLFKIALLALCLVALGALSPMPGTNPTWGDDNPSQVVEVFRTGKCKRYSDGFFDYWWGIITGRKFEYCPCIPMDLGELGDWSEIFSNLGTIFASLPGGFWKGEIDLAIKTKDPHLEAKQQDVWKKEWVQDAGSRELVIQAEAMVKSIEIARSAALLNEFNAILGVHASRGIHSTNFRNRSWPKDLIKFLPATYTGITPMNGEEVRIDAYAKKYITADLLALKKGGDHYSSVQSAIDALYNELLKDDEEKDPFGNIAELYNKITKLIDSFKKALNVKESGWKAITSIPTLISGVTDAMNSLKDALNIGGFGFSKRMMLYQVLDAMLDDVVKNVKVWVAAVLDKNPTYPLGLVKDSIMPVMKDMMLLLFIIPPEKGQTKMLQLATDMTDQQAGLSELNEYILSSFQDRKMFLDQAKNSKKAAVKSNITTIGHDAATVGNSGKSHKIGF